MAPFSLLAMLTARRAPRFLPPQRSNGDLADATKAMRSWLRGRGRTVLFAVAMVIATVGGAAWFTVPPDSAGLRIRTCDEGTFRQAKVTVHVKIDVAGLAYPRVTSHVEVTVPRATWASELLLADPSSGAGRSALACLLGGERAPSEVRETAPKVETRAEAIVVTQRSYADVVNANDTWTDLARIVVGTNDQPWLLTVHSPLGLRYATWDVSLEAPEGWLSDPSPSKNVEAGNAQLRWPPSTPATSRDGNLHQRISDQVVRAHLTPDTRSEFTAGAADRRHKPFAWGAYWLSALVFVFYITRVLRIPRRGRRPDSPTDQATRYLIPLVVLTGTLAVVDAASPQTQSFWHPFGWAANGVLLAVMALAALHWQAPRSAVLMWYAIGQVAWLFTFPRLESDGRWWDGVAEVVLSFVITLLLVVWIGTALLKVLMDAVKTPTWLWGVASLSGAVLVLERLLLAHVNHHRQQWLGASRTDRDITEIYRFYPLDLVDETAWLALLIGVAAIWRHASRFPQDDKRSSVPVAIALFAVGPMWWEVHLWGVWWPIGSIALLLFWLARQRLGSLSADPTDASPADNMRTAVRFARIPALIAGTGLVGTKWAVYPLVTINQQDSVVLGMIDTVAWEAVKWLLAAAALGLAWQRLPGTRWPTKVLPFLPAYAIAPVGQYLIDRSSNGVDNWGPLVDASLFVSVLVFVAARLDFVLRPATPAPHVEPGRIGKLLTRIGVSNLRGHVGEAAAVIMAALAIWAAVTGGEVAFPSVDPSQFSRTGVAER